MIENRLYLYLIQKNSNFLAIITNNKKKNEKNKI